MSVPVLLISFNRPSHTRKVLEAVLVHHPQELFLFQDGPRHNNPSDIGKCKEVRAVFDSFLESNPGIVHHSLFSEVNLGCGPGPAKAISWFFEHVDQGIILEDDAIPHPDFFPYAEELLERYKYDYSVYAIGSMNIDMHKWGDGSYYFSMMNRNLCAWASWKRAWDQFDIQLEDVSRRKMDRALRRYKCGKIERLYWLDRLDEVHKDCCGGKSWDMQFFMSIWLKRGKGIIPNVNLSSNIGTVDDATHRMAAGNLIDNIPTQPILPLVHPTTIEIQNRADREFHYRYFEPQKKNWPPMKKARFVINKTLKRLIGHQGPWIRK